MDAKEMFEKLGYERTVNIISDTPCIHYVKYLGKIEKKKHYKCIYFNKYKKELTDITIEEYLVYKNDMTRWQITFDEKELQAIDKQIEELNQLKKTDDELNFEYKNTIKSLQNELSILRYKINTLRKHVKD